MARSGSVSLCLVFAFLVMPVFPSLAGGIPVNFIKNVTANLPLSFEANVGQTDPRVKYFARNGRSTVFLTAEEAVVRLGGSVVRMRLTGAGSPAIAGANLQSGKNNYFIGNDPSRWYTDVPHYGRVEYTGVYPGIDLFYYGTGRQLEYDWVVSPGADPNRIRMKYQGTRAIRIDKNGDLVLAMKDGELRHRKPEIYQETNGKKQLVEGRFVLRHRNEVGFQVAAYDHSKPLTIDPILAYATYLGGSARDQGEGIAVDASGNAYIAGQTSSANFPVPFTGSINSINRGKNTTCVDSYYDSQLGPQTVSEPCQDIFVTKLDPTGQTVLYSTFIGGSLTDGGTGFEPWPTNVGIALDSAGNAYVAGASNSTDFPTTSNAFQTTAKAGGEAVLFKLNPNGNQLLFATYFGGSGADAALGVAVSEVSQANGVTPGVYIVGGTQSFDLPVKQPLPGFSTAPDKNRPECNPTPTLNQGCSDGFIAKFDLNGVLQFASYIGTSNGFASHPNGPGSDEVNSVDVDPSGRVYVVGKADAGLTATSGVAQIANAGRSDLFVTSMTVSSVATTVNYLTYLGGSEIEKAKAIKVDPSGTAYITGQSTAVDPTVGTNYPTTPGAFQRLPKPHCSQPNCTVPTEYGNGNVVVSKLDSTGKLLASTLISGRFAPPSPGGFVFFESKGQGIAVDSQGSIFVGGYTYCTDFPSTPNAPQPANAGGEDVFIIKFDPNLTTPLFATYFGGLQDDWGFSLAIDRTRDGVYMTGFSTQPKSAGTGFPEPPHAFQPNFQGGYSDAFAVKLANADIALSLSSTSTHAPTGLRGPTDTGGPVNASIDALNRVTLRSGSDARNVSVSGSLPQGQGGLTLMHCTYTTPTTSGNCANGFNISVPPTDLAAGADLHVDTDYRWDGSIPAGGQFNIGLSANSATNDPDPSNNSMTLSFPVLTIDTVPHLSTARLTIDGTPKGGVPYTALYDGSSSHSLCASPFIFAATASFQFANWIGPNGYTSTSACAPVTTVQPGLYTAKYAQVANVVLSGRITGISAPASLLVTSSSIPNQISPAFPATVPTDASGNYSISLPAGVTYTVTPTLSGYSFVPNSLSTTLPSGPVNFTATPTIGTSPIGVLDTPVDGASGLAGAFTVGGWALSTVGITNVGLWREPIGAEPTAANGLIFLVNATTIPGARPDVAAAFPSYPQNNYGWGAQILTNGLPGTNGLPQGNGSYRIHAIATNPQGGAKDIGTVSVSVNNTSSLLPFGTIDTPVQGGVVSGKAYVNFGWVLTPQPNIIPVDGSSITVFIDNVAVGHPDYNHARADIQSGFPNYRNTNGAVGFFVIDTTKLTNGLHTIAWSASDNAGHATGIGSRFFIVQN